MTTGDTYDVRSMQTLDSLDWLPLEKTSKTTRSNYDIQSTNYSRSLRYLEKFFSASQNDNYNLRSNETKSKLLKPKTHFLKEVSRI